MENSSKDCSNDLQHNYQTDEHRILHKTDGHNTTFSIITGSTHIIALEKQANR